MTDHRTIAVPLGGYGRHLITLSLKEEINFAKVSSFLAAEVSIKTAYFSSAVLRSHTTTLCSRYH